MKNKILPRKKKSINKKIAASARKAKIKVSRRKVKEAPRKPPLFGIHTLKPPKGSRRKKKLLGRGTSSGHGKTSTRGSKGQTSRSGRDFYLGFEGGQMPLIRKVPKRGFINEFKKEYQVINLDDLDRIKEATINPELLEKEGLIRDKARPVKILGDGEIKKAVNIQAHAFSRKALEKINTAGGKAEVINA